MSDMQEVPQLQAALAQHTSQSSPWLLYRDTDNTSVTSTTTTECDSDYDANLEHSNGAEIGVNDGGIDLNAEPARDALSPMYKQVSASNTEHCCSRNSCLRHVDETAY